MAPKDVDGIFRDYNYEDERDSSSKDNKKRFQKMFDRHSHEDRHMHESSENENLKDEIRDLKDQIHDLKREIRPQKEKPRFRPEPGREEPSYDRPKKDVFKKSNPQLIERIVLIGIIVLLCGFIIFDLSFYKHVPKGEKTEGPQVQTADDTALVATPPANETQEEETVEEEVDEETSEEEEEVVEEEEEEPEVEYSDEVYLQIDKVYYEINEEDDDLAYVDKIKFTLKNDRDKILRPIITAYIHDEEFPDYETKSRATYRSVISVAAGESFTGTIEGLTPRTHRNLDIEKHVRISLNDTEEGYLAVARKDITIE